MAHHSSVNYVEPNISSPGLNGFFSTSNIDSWKTRDSYNRSPRLEDYCIVLNIEVEVCSRDNIFSSGKEETDVLIMQWTTHNNNDGKSSTVSFLGGTKVKSNNANNHSVNYLTTNYADMYVGDLVDYGTTEMIGVKSVDIEYQKSCVPILNIVFTDVRGLSLFQPTELSRTNQYNGIKGLSIDNIAQSFFQCFFRVPMPKFTITLKGFYGKPVTYEVMCDKFDTKFNSSTGDFDINTRFIGYSYSFLTDISMDALIAAPYSDYEGKKYWSEKVKDGTFVLWNKEKTKLVDMPTLVEISAEIDKILALPYGDNLTGLEDEEKNHTEQINMLTNIRSMYENWYSTLYNIVCERYGKEYCFVSRENSTDGDYKGIVILKQMSNDSKVTDLSADYATYPDSFKKLNSDLYTAIEEYKSKGFNFNNIENVSEDFYDYDLRALFNKIYINSDRKLFFNGFDKRNELPETEIINAVFYGVSYTKNEKGEDLTEQEIQTKREQHKNYVLQNIYYDGVNQYTYCYYINPNYRTIKNIINALKNDANSKVDEREEKKKNEALNQKIYGEMKWYPTVENFTRIMLAHLETLMHMMYTCVDSMKGRTAGELGVSAGENGVLNDTNLNKKDEVPPFPRVTRNILGDDEVVKREDIWVGEYQEGTRRFEEIELINGLLNGIDDIQNVFKDTQSQVNDFLNTQKEAEEHPKNIIKRPLSCYDFFITGSPYGNSDEICNDIYGYDFAGKVAMRMFILLSVSYLSLSFKTNWESLIEEIATAEALNFKDLVRLTNTNFLSRLRNNELNVDFIISAITSSNDSENCPWGNNVLFAESNGEFDLVGYNGIYPVQNVRFSERENVLNILNEKKVTNFNGEFVFRNSDSIIKEWLDDTSLGTLFISDNAKYGVEALENASDASSSDYSAIFNEIQSMVDFNTKDENLYEAFFKTSENYQVPSFSERIGNESNPTKGYSIWDANNSTFVIGDRKIKNGDTVYVWDEENKKEIIEFKNDWAKSYNYSVNGIYRNAIGGATNRYTVSECFGCTENGSYDFNTSFMYNINEHENIKDWTITYNGKSFKVQHLAVINGFYVNWGEFKNYISSTDSFLYLPKIVLLQLGVSIIYNNIDEINVNSGYFKDFDYVKKEIKSVIQMNLELRTSSINLSDLARFKVVDYLYNWIKKNESLLDSFILPKQYAYLIYNNIRRDTSILTEAEKYIKNSSPYTVPYILLDYILNSLNETEKNTISAVRNVGESVSGIFDDYLYNRRIILDENSDITQRLTYELLSVCYVSRLSIFSITENKKTKFSLSHARTYLTTFLEKLKVCYGMATEVKDSNGRITRITKEPPGSTDDVKKELYRYLKQIYDKWIPMNNMSDWTLDSFFKDEEGVGHNFYFIDSFYNYIGDKLLVNPKVISEKVKAFLSYRDVNTMMLGFMADMYAANRCMLMSIQNFFDLKKYGSMEDMFSLKSFGDIPWNSLHRTPSFVVVYPYEPSKNLDIPNNEYVNDGFMLNDENETPIAIKTKTNKLGKNGQEIQYNIPAFGVSYGKQYQSYFKSININMQSPVATQQAILAKHYILQESAGTTPKNKTVAAQDLFDIYSTQSYTCDVEMMGCAWVQPLMYFVLLNVPMFRGSYMIMKVSHSLSPGNMTTKFTGCRMANVSTKFVENIFSNEDLNVPNGGSNGGGGGSNSVDRTQLASMDNDCPYKVYPLYGGGDIEMNGTVLENAVKMMKWFVENGFKEEAAAGIVGNIVQECGCNPATANTDSDNYLAGGLCGWNDHYGNLTNMINNRTTNYGGEPIERTWNSQGKAKTIEKLKEIGLEHQLNYIVNTLTAVTVSSKDGTRYSKEKLESYTTPESAAESFRAAYERGTESSKRQKNARDVYTKYKEENNGVQTSSPQSDPNNKEDIYEAFFKAIEKTCNSTPSLNSIKLTKEILNADSNNLRLMRVSTSDGNNVEKVFDMIVSTNEYMKYVFRIWWETMSNGQNYDANPKSIVLQLDENVEPNTRGIFIVDKHENRTDGYNPNLNLSVNNVSILFRKSLCKRRMSLNNDEHFKNEIPQFANEIERFNEWMPKSCDSIVSSVSQSSSSNGCGGSSGADVSVSNGAKIGGVGDSWMNGYRGGGLSDKLAQKGLQCICEVNVTCKDGANHNMVKGFAENAVQKGADVIVINCGLNDGVKTSYIEEIGKACGDKKVFFCTIPHGIASGTATQEQIDEFNKSLSEICTNNGWGIIDVASLNQRSITIEMTGYGGYHPSGDGYKRIASFIADTLGDKIT